jgi:hypothetical protein
MEGLAMPQWTALNERRLAMDGSAIKLWTACNGRLGNGRLDNGRLSNKALYGSAIKLDDAAMDGLRWTAPKKWLHDGAMDGSAMSRWTAHDGQLSPIDGLAMDGLAMDGYGLAITCWTARRCLDVQLAMDNGSRWTARR